MYIVEIQEASKKYGEVIALSRFSMHVQKGIINGFIGPNGAGKSTTLRMITGLTAPDSGTVRVFGNNPLTDAGARKRMGFVSEYDDMYGWARVRDLMKYMYRLTYPIGGNVNEKITRTLKTVGMEKYPKRKVSSLSKGMRQRVKIGMALMHDPEFLILDEPLFGLDPIGRRDMSNLFRTLCNEHGVTILISSHILEELEDIVQRVVLIHRGQTIAEGDPAKIRALINKYPHEVIFQALSEHSRAIISELVQVNGLIRKIEIRDMDDREEIRIITPNLDRFYDELVRVAVERVAPFTYLDNISENIEKLFEYLVTGGRGS